MKIALHTDLFRKYSIEEAIPPALLRYKVCYMLSSRHFAGRIKNSMQLSQAVHHFTSFSLPDISLAGSNGSANDCLPRATISTTFSFLPVFSMLVVMNFFRGLPKELEEAAFIDSASHLVTLIRIILPISNPALATVGLFCLVGHWNSWFDGLLYMNRQEQYPDQLLNFVNVRTTKAALGSVKG